MSVDNPGYRRDVHLLLDRESILGSRAILDELAHISDQPGAANDLDYRLAYHRLSPGAQRKTPCLLLISAGCGVGDPARSVNGIVGAVLLFEYRLPGVGLRLYTTADTTGRRTVIAPMEYRAQIAAYACRALMAQGAQVVVMSVQVDEEDQAKGPQSAGAAIQEEMAAGVPGVRAEWSLIERANPVYLPLAETYDETLAAIGKKTRTQMRYYRRRAEKELGCEFVPEVEIGLEEFVAFNRRCMYAVTDDLARWRYEERGRIERPVFQGLRDGKGNWLSLAGGRRTGDHVELEWQCNRTDLPASSLSTVMRAYLIDHEVALGMKRLYFEGGTPSSLQQSFVVEGAADLTVCRRSRYVWLIRRLAKWLFPPKNQMAQILMDKGLKWTKC